MSARFVECLGFAGGFALGAVQSGLEMVAKREDGPFGVPSCEANRHLLGTSWEVDTRGPATWEPVDGVDVVLGNPSCGGFSIKSTSGSVNNRGVDAKANQGMVNFVNYAGRCRPTIAVFESVQGARTLGHEFMVTLRDALENVSGLRYGLTHVRHSAHTLGGAGLRPRYFWVASRVPFGVEYRDGGTIPVLHDVISDLETQPLSWDATAYAAPPTWWSRGKRTAAGTVDGHVLMDTPKVSRLADLLTGPFPFEPGEYLEQFVLRYGRAGLPLPPSMAAVSVGIGQMIRWEYDRPARTVVRDTSTMAIHPILDRFLTHREVARVMGFPDDWTIEGSRRLTKSKSMLQHTFGKGVTVECGRWISHWIGRALAGDPGIMRGVPVGDREWDIDVTHGLASDDESA